MASYNIPQANNPILGDLSAINALLISAAKMDPATGNTNLPSGAKRLTPVSGGYQLQSFDGSKWTSIDKLIHDADTLDGKHANTGTVKDTIPIRNSAGALAGDITGNAASATKLKEAKNIDIGGIASATEQSFDGSKAITIPINSINVKNEDDTALIGQVSKAHGGTGRTDGAAADVIVSSLEGDVKASEYGQIGDSRRIDGYDLNSLVVNGIYLARGGTVENHFPREIPTASCVTVYVSRSASHILQILCGASGEIWQRRSADSGATWLLWNCSSYPAADTVTFYISKSGSDSNNGMDSDHPVLNISKALSLADKIHSQGANYVRFFVGEGNWGKLTLRSLPYVLQIFSYSGNTATSYSDSLPKFTTILSENTAVYIGSIVCEFVDAALNGSILISTQYSRIGTFRARHGGVIEIDGGASAYPLEIIARDGHDCVYYAYNFGYICHLGGRSVNVIESLNLSSGFLVSNTNSSISINGAQIKTVGEAVVSGRRYQINKASAVIGVSLDQLPGSQAGVKQVGAIIDGIPYGGGASDEALMADLSWKPVLLQTGGTLTGSLNINVGGATGIALMNTNNSYVDLIFRRNDESGRLAVFRGTTNDDNNQLQIGVNGLNDEAPTGMTFRRFSDRTTCLWEPAIPNDAPEQHITTIKWVRDNLSKYLPLEGGELSGNLKIRGMDLFLGDENKVHTQLRDDGNTFYILLDSAGTDSFNALRPLSINHSTGEVTFQNGANVSSPSDDADGSEVTNASWVLSKVNSSSSEKNMLPDFSRTPGQQKNTWYTADTNGYLCYFGFNITTGNHFIYISITPPGGSNYQRQISRSYNSQSTPGTFIIPISKGTQYQILDPDGAATGSLVFMRVK